MANNVLSFNQCSTLLNAIQAQATGASALAAVDETEFVTVAQTTLATGADIVLSAISQVLSKTLFSIRPYSRKLKGLNADAVRYGNHVRKLQVVDKAAVNEDKWGLTDGSSVDQFVVRKPTVLQTNFYGFNSFEDYITVFDDQLNVAFSSSDEFGRFMTMIMQNISDKREQWFENMARATLCNFIKGKHLCDSASEVHLVTGYNNLIGNLIPPTDPSFDPTTDEWLALADLYQPENFKPFMHYVFAKIAEVSELMTERSQKFQANITGSAIMRHTPKADQMVYLWAPVKFQSEMMALADTYHDNYLSYADNEALNFFQSISTPNTITSQAVYLNTTTGGITKEASATSLGNIFGVIVDREAIGYSPISDRMYSTPHNARGCYTNLFWHTDVRYWNDFTEKGVLLLLD